MEAGIMALVASIFNCFYMWLKNRSQDKVVGELRKKVCELDTSVQECHEERDELRAAIDNITRPPD